jgi:hypothetical protein
MPNLYQNILKGFVVFLALNTNTFHHYMGDEALLFSMDTPSGPGREGEEGVDE